MLKVCATSDHVVSATKSFVHGENPANYKPPQQIAIIPLFNHTVYTVNVVTSTSTFGCTPRHSHYTLHYSLSHCKYTDVNKALLSISFVSLFQNEEKRRKQQETYN